MTMIITKMDEETLEHLDFEFTPPCEREPCDKKAEYKVVFACCGHVMLWCEFCYADAERYTAAGGLWHCEKCQATDIDKPFAMVDKL
jgi:hypothetical protein